MEQPLRELVFNEARALSLFANGRVRDHRFALSLVCEDIPDPRFNRTYLLEPAKLTSESLEEISMEFFSIRLPQRMDIFLPIPEETESLLKRRKFGLTEEHASIMLLEEFSSALKGNKAVSVEKLSPDLVDTYARLMLKAYEAPADVAITYRSILRHTIPDVFDNKGGELYLAYLKGEPVGTLYLFTEGEMSGVYNLAVSKSARREGIATTLMLEAIRESRAYGAKAMCIQTRVGSFQERFFERLGFKTVAQRKRAIRDLE